MLLLLLLFKSKKVMSLKHFRNYKGSSKLKMNPGKRCQLWMFSLLALSI